MSYAVGSLVKARGREWVVLPESEEELLVLRPLGGTEDEVTGIYLPLEPVEAARFDLPDPNRNGDYRSCRLLRDAVRLGFRSSAGPFRSFGQIAVEPRPYPVSSAPNGPQNRSGTSAAQHGHAAGAQLPPGAVAV